MEIPKLFISYSHDTLEHKKWVLDLATRLRNNGIDAILDQWELSPGDDLPHFMETNLSSSNYIIIICTQKYVDKANQGKGGVGYEKMIITSSLMSQIDESKIIPIIRQNGTFNVPTFLKTKLFIDFSKNDDFEYNIDELIRKAHKTPIFKKPEIGNNPFKSIKENPLEKENDAIQDLIKILADDYETEDYSEYFDVKEKLNISRIMFDYLISEAKAKGYVIQDNDKDLYLTDSGKLFAIDKNMVTQYKA